MIDAKQNKGDKKVMKSLLKLGMKRVDGVTRVTLKKRDGMVFIVDDPQVLRSADNENSFAVVGELKFDDPRAREQQATAAKYAEAQKMVAEQMAKAKKAEASGKAGGDAADKDDGPALSEEGITSQHISMVMEHTNCKRNEAIKALHESKDDMIQAVMNLTK
jgi:nascent polypeptide-associated complex subunit alpha